MNKDVVEECLAFCQALSNNNQLFSLSLKIGSDTFNFHLKELVKSSCVKKKKSPSQLRREKRRRDERKQAVTKAEEDAVEASEKSAVKLKCNPCGNSFGSEEELNAHNESVHKTLTSPEKERGIGAQCELQLSPLQVNRYEDNLSEQEGASSPVSLAPELSPVEFPCVLNARQLCVKTFTLEEDLKNHMMKAHYGGACINCQLWDPRKKCKERKSCRTVYDYYRHTQGWQCAGGVFGKVAGIDHRCDE